MRIAFICTTPYAIFNSINLKIHNYKEDEVDLFIVGDFKDRQKYIDNIKKSNFFCNVYCIKYPDVDSEVEKVKIRLAMLIDKVEFFIREIKIKYDVINACWWEPFTSVLIFNQKRGNQKLVVNFFEDGMATYTSKKQLEVASKIHKIRKIRYSDYIDEMNMYKPSYGIYNKLYKKVSQLPSPNEEIINILECIFDIRKEDKQEIFKHNIIYLDQPLEEVSWGAGRKQLIEEIMKHLDVAEFAIKRHPRKQDFNYREYKIQILPELQGPWEVIASSIKGKVLITFNSTAALTPSFIYNNNNRVIFLYKYFMKDHPLCLEWDKFFYKIKDMYSDYIFIPETKEDLIEVLKKAKEWIEKTDEYTSDAKI